MDKDIQDYLQRVAIQTKVENFKEFGKTKEETADAIAKNFSLSVADASGLVEQFWENTPYSSANGADMSYVQKRQQLIYEKENKMQEYDQAIQVLEDAINGFSPKTIAMQKGLTLEKVEEILGH